MSRNHEMTRRVALQSLLALPGAVALAQEEPLIENNERPIWNEAYSEEESPVTNYPNRFLADVVEGRSPCRAFDIGMGQGRNSIFLAKRGWDVTGVDISDKGIELARKNAERADAKVNCVVADFLTFSLGKEKWDLIVGVYVGGLILSQAQRIADSLRPGGLLVAENFHEDVHVSALSGGRIGYPVNALLETFAPWMRIVRYEEIRDFPDWYEQNDKLLLVRMLARKG